MWFKCAWNNYSFHAGNADISYEMLGSGNLGLRLIGPDNYQLRKRMGAASTSAQLMSDRMRVYYIVSFYTIYFSKCYVIG